MYKTTKNPQALRSMHLMADALFELMEQYPYPDITILQICQQSETARKTFYRNFDTKEDILDFILDSLICDFTAARVPGPFILTEEVHSCFSYFHTHRSMLGLMCRNGLLHTVTRKVKLYLQQSDCAAHAAEEASSAHMKPYFEQYVASSITCVLELWIQREFRESISDLCDFTISMLLQSPISE